MNMHGAFDRNAAGNVITKPLVGFNAGFTVGTDIQVRLEYTDTLAHLGAIMMGAEKPDVLQLTLKPAQAKEIAHQLSQLADMILSRQIVDEKTP